MSANDKPRCQAGRATPLSSLGGGAGGDGGGDGGDGGGDGGGGAG